RARATRECAREKSKPNEHGGPRRPKPLGPAVPWVGSEPGADQRTEERAEVDPHVVESEAGVAAGVGAAGELPAHGVDIGLEETGPEYNEGESAVEDPPLAQCQAEVSRRD